MAPPARGGWPAAPAAPRRAAVPDASPGAARAGATPGASRHARLLDGARPHAHLRPVEQPTPTGDAARMPRAPLIAALLLGTALPAAAQDAEAGQRVFNQCRACHSINAGGRNGVGPNLHGILDRKAGTAEGFRYSASLREKAAGGLVWDEATLRAYIANPKAVVPAGSMSFPGLRNEQQLGDLIAYLKSNS
ncbi:c-type cytochrome [Paeniroseomonas aquatica]